MSDSTEIRKIIKTFVDYHLELYEYYYYEK